MISNLITKDRLQDIHKISPNTDKRIDKNYSGSFFFDKYGANVIRKTL